MLAHLLLAWRQNGSRVENDVGPMRLRLGNCSSFLLETSSQFSHRYDLRRQGRADIFAWPNAFDPARRAQTRDMHLGEA